MTCSRCSGPLYQADLIVGSAICCDCARKAVVLAADPWAFFVRTLRAHVRADGTVHVNDVRELLRGRIEPKQIGLLWRRAKSAGLIHGGREWEPSSDGLGRNDDKQARIWRAGPDLTRSAAGTVLAGWLAS